MTIGAVWFGIKPLPGAHFAYLYDLHIDDAVRREHHARVTLRLLEARCRELDASSIGLQVFAHDTMAQALYSSLGFNITSFNMIKRIDGA
jgi:ribosomal protein S18 acetylase RimI-like enzyme